MKNILALLFVMMMAAAGAQNQNFCGEPGQLSETDILKLELQKKQSLHLQHDEDSGYYSKQDFMGGSRSNQNKNRGTSIIWNNGPFITHPGAGTGGSHYSVVQDASLGMSEYGFDFEIDAGNTLADDFVLTDTTFFEEIIFYGFEHNENTSISSINKVRLRIWDGNPAFGGEIIFGNLADNMLISSGWTGTWRVLESDPEEERPVMEVVADVYGLILTPGTYWVDFQVHGYWVGATLSPPITVLGETQTGNALLYSGSSGGWEPVFDVGYQGIPFMIRGDTTVPYHDVSVTKIIKPATGTNLGNAETIKFEIRNLGIETQSEIPYYVTWSGPTGSDTVYGTLSTEMMAGDTAIIQLEETVNLSVFGNYQIEF